MGRTEQGPSEGQRALLEQRQHIEQVCSERSCVLSAPTGTGKSTLVPPWLSGRVLVIEPRRVACQALARRVAELLEVPLGRDVGYRVRDDDRASEATRIVYATPGIVLSNPSWADAFEHVVLDEFHERRLDTDWLYAYFKRRGKRLLVMSATIEAERIAQDLSAELVEVHAKAYPVEVHYLGSGSDLPEVSDWERLAQRALAQLPDDSGDVLVFLPGKGEIRRLKESLSLRSGQAVFELHGSLPLAQQARVFEPTPGRKIILSTNVAETSLTLPDVRTVIDSGLVRRTHYHGGRSTLAIANIALDSVAQRTGRAGRTAPGTCLRLWGRAAQLQAQTPPEVQREGLAEFVLWTAAAGLRVEELPCLDAPKPEALANAFEDLRALGALDDASSITERGRRLHRLPLDAWYGRVLVEAEARGTLDDCIDLVAALAHVPRIQLPSLEDPEAVPPCDAVALVRAVRDLPKSARVDARRELVKLRQRLRQMMNLTSPLPKGEPQREAMLQTVVAADPRSAHVARVRKQRVAWAAGGTELGLDRASYAEFAREPEAIVVLETHTSGVGKRRRAMATRASAVRLSFLAKMGLGQEQVRSVKYKGGTLLASVEQVYVGKVLAKKEVTPTGAVARAALVELLLAGRLFREAVAETKQRLQRRALAHSLARAPGFEHLALGELSQPPALEDWLKQRVSELGFESAEDLELLSAEDFVAQDVGAELLPTLESEFPLSVDTGDCRYAVEYDLEKRQVLLTIVRGSRTAPPPLNFLPKFRGFRICVEAGRRLHVLREARR